MKTFLLIEHGGAGKQFTLQTLKNKDLEVYLACSQVPDWLESQVPKSNIIVTDTYHPTKLIADVVSFFESKNIEVDAVGTFFEHTVTQTAVLASTLGLVGNDPGAAFRSSSNKLLMRKFCKNKGIKTPKFAVLGELSKVALEKAVAKVGLPCVLKPVFGAESHGTVKIEHQSDLDEIIKEVVFNITANKKEVFKNFTKNFILEEYLPGTVVSVDGLIQNGTVMIVGMVEFVMGKEPRFTQEANYIPPTLPMSVQEECCAMTSGVIKAIEIDNCGFHCELRITPNGPVLIEIAARLPGGPLQPGYKKAMGVDLASLLIDVWLGEKIELNAVQENYVLQKAVFPDATGKIVAVEGLEHIDKEPAVWDFFQISNVGEDTVTYPNIPKPLYYYAVAAKDKDELTQLARRIEGLIKYKIK